MSNMTVYDMIMLKTASRMPIEVKTVIDSVSPCLQDVKSIIDLNDIKSIRVYDSKSRMDIYPDEDCEEYNGINYQAFVNRSTGHVVLLIDNIVIPYNKKSMHIAELAFEDSKLESTFYNRKRNTYDSKTDAVYIEESTGSFKYLMKVDNSSHCIYIWITKQIRG